ncbi:unnamed protein product [Caenorhabditis brenneri]
MSMRQYDIPTENRWASLRVQLEGREYTIFVDDELYETFPDIASSLTLPVGQMVVEIKFRTPKNHLVSVNGNSLKKVRKNTRFGNFSFFDNVGSNFHFWDSTKRQAELKKDDVIIQPYQLKNG